MALPDPNDKDLVFETEAAQCHNYKYEAALWPPRTEYCAAILKRDFPQYLTRTIVSNAEGAKNVVPEYYAYLWGYYSDETVNRHFYVVGVYKTNRCGGRDVGKPKSSYVPSRQERR